MTIKTKIIKIGNSKGIILASTLLDHLDIKVGDNLSIILSNDSITLKKYNKKVLE